MKNEISKKLQYLSDRLSWLQRECRKYKIPVMITIDSLVAKDQNDQKAAFIRKLITPLDPRWFSVYAMSKTKKEHPFLKRYYTRVPRKGEFAIFDHNWYDMARQEGFLEFDQILAFEKMMAEDDTIIIKIMLSKKPQKEICKRYRSLYEMLSKTSFSYAPWVFIQTDHTESAIVELLSSVIEYIEKQLLKKKEDNTDSQTEEGIRNLQFASVLKSIDLKKECRQKEYHSRIKPLQKSIYELQKKCIRQKVPVILLFEGQDAAGKGGSIKRLTKYLDPRYYEVVPICAPNDTEKSYHYLWRFFKELPDQGEITIFDRSWYGRVLVERIEHFCKDAEWNRAYEEINQFEKHLTEEGMILIKFWLQIDKTEQEKRFKQRMDTPSKQWKITDEDWRNRAKWEEYEEAAGEMLFHTSTPNAPWTIVEANSKYYARIKILKTIQKVLKKI